MATYNIEPQPVWKLYMYATTFIPIAISARACHLDVSIEVVWRSFYHS